MKTKKRKPLAQAGYRRVTPQPKIPVDYEHRLNLVAAGYSLETIGDVLMVKTKLIPREPWQTEADHQRLEAGVHESQETQSKKANKSDN